MSATKVLDLAEKQALLDANVVADLRKQVAESKFVVTAEAIAKILVDHGHLTAFQARKLVSTALGEAEPVVPTPVAPKSRAPAPAPAPRPQDSDLGLADSSSHDDIVEMKVAAPAAKPPMAKAPPPKKPPRSMAETRPMDVAPRPVPPKSAPPPLVQVAPPGGAPAVLEPIAAPGARPAAASPLQPVDPLSVDPLHAATDREKPKARVKAPPKESPWKNPTYLLMGGGTLLVMFIAFWILYYALFQTPIAQLFIKAGEAYDSGSLGAAKEMYEEFLKRSDPKTDDASTARVRLGMIDLRQASGEGRNPGPGIEAANRILPELLKEKQFDDCRLLLRTILTEMASTSAKSAHAAKATDAKVKLVAQTEAAMKLVENASYIPSSLRGDVQAQINKALDVLKAARRSIDQDQDLVKTIEEMKKATETKEAATAYQKRSDLLRTYPALESDKELHDATIAVVAMEQAQVRLDEDPIAPLTADAEGAAAASVLSQPSGGDTGLAGQFIATLVQGAVYGLDAKDGKLLWRRAVGHDAVAWPMPVSGDQGADFLLVDSQRQELLRVAAADGKLVWRLPIGQAFSPPTLGTEQAYVTTADGRILEVNLATGQSQRQVQLPQKPAVSPAFDSRKLKLFQLGRHSTLFVLDADRLNCTETFYLGHKAGAIFVPPAVALDHIVVAESPGDDFTLIHGLAPDAETRKLKEVVEPIRLRGRVVLPLQVDRNRVVAVTDLGQVAVLQVDTSNKQRPLRLMATSKGSSTPETLPYFTVAPGQVFVTGKGVACLEIQATTQDLKSLWQLHASEIFSAPPQVIGKVLFHVRRPRTSTATVVEACQVERGQTIWKTEIAAPIAALYYHDQRQELTALTSRGRVYEVPLSALPGANIDKAAFLPLPGSESISLTDVVPLGSDKLALLGPQSSPYAILYDPHAAANRTQQVKFTMPIEQATASATYFQGGLALPQETGQVLLLDPASAGHKAQPYQPPLQAGQRIAWNQAAVIPPDGTLLAVADGQRTIYRLAIKVQPQPHLEALGETVVESDVVAPLAASGDTVYAVVRSAANDLVVGLQSADLTNAGKTPLAGRVQFGPASAAGLVFVADESTLYAFESGGKVRWSQSLTHGLPAMAPLSAGGDLILVTRRGTVCRLAADSGQELAAAEMGEPAGGAAVIVGERIVVAGADGTLCTLALPKRQ